MKYILLGLILLLAVCLSLAHKTQSELSKQTSLPTPIGWSLYTKPDVNSREMLCGNYSKREWYVSSGGEQLKIQLIPRQGYQRDPLPFRIKLTRTEEYGTSGHRHVHKLEDGWAIGFDQGEFGGSLWWFSPDGKQHKKLANGNIKYFVSLSGELFVLEGLAHLGSAGGKVLRVRQTETGEYKADVWASLDGEPYGFAKESDNSLLIITTSGLRRMRKSGTVEELIETDYGALYPNSIALARNNIVYVGMRHFITRLIPTSEGYKEEWLVPNDCTRFAVNENKLNCVCFTPPNQ
jgi:hypothetical protein